MLCADALAVWRTAVASGLTLLRSATLTFATRQRDNAPEEHRANAGFKEWTDPPPPNVLVLTDVSVDWRCSSGINRGNRPSSGRRRQIKFRYRHYATKITGRSDQTRRDRVSTVSFRTSPPNRNIVRVPDRNIERSVVDARVVERQRYRL